MPIDLRRIDLPVYWLSTREDHIAPWKSTYAATQLYAARSRFVLAGSGHIAGVVNPPASGKYGYWTNDELPADPEAWLAGAAASRGLLVGRLGAVGTPAMPASMVPARVPGAGKLPALEDAPGSYVKSKA